MDNSIRDMAVWYPLVPDALHTAVPDFVKHVLDMKVYVRLYAEDLVQQTDGMNIDMLDAWLTGTTTVTVSRTGASPVVVSLQVFTGRDSRPQAGTSYIVMDESVQFYGGPYKVHPDCFVFLQDAPVIQLMARGGVMSTDGRPMEGGGRINGAVGDPVPVPSAELAFASGYNVQADYLDGTLSFDGMSGYGAGVYDTPPYVDVSAYSTRPGKGLRSINGVTGDVSIEAGSVLDVDDAVSGDTITITLKPKELAEGDGE